MAKRKRIYKPVHERVPAGPFAEWLNERFARFLVEAGGSLSDVPPGRGPAQRLCEEIGWGYAEVAARRLYRYRRCLTDTKANGRRIVKEAETVRRSLVEDALHAAGVDFYDVYPDYAHERCGDPEPEAWCPSCQSHVMVDKIPHGAGHVFRCVWCRWRMSKGHLNEQGILELVA